MRQEVTYREGMLEVPRSVVLAAWAGAVAAGRAGPAAALAAVTGTDEPHTTTWAAVGPDSSAPTGAPPHGPGAAAPSWAVGESAGPLAGGTLSDLLTALAGSGARVRAALPAPGDPSGLAGPPVLTAEAVDAGEVVLVDDTAAPAGGRSGDGAATATALVPEVTTFGSFLEPGAHVAWTIHRARVRPDAEAMPLSSAARVLRAALSSATGALTDLDVARWREDAADRLSDARGGALSRDAFPPSAPPEAVSVATTAARVLLIVELAGGDDGGSLVSAEASARREVLREVDAVARAALAVAASSTGRGDQRPSAAS